MATPMDTIEKSPVLRELFLEVDGFDASLFPPQDEVKETETVVGACPEYARKFYALARMYGREARQIELDKEFSSQKAGGEGSFDERASECRAKMELLMNMVWLCIRFELGLFDADKVGLRANWKVVTATMGGTDLPSFLKKLFEG